MLTALVFVLASLASSAHKDAYIIAMGDNNTFNTGTSLDEFLVLHRQHRGRYIWVRRDGRQYIIRDEATIQRAEALFAPEMRLSPQQEAAGREEARVDKEADRLEDKGHLTAGERERLQELRAQQRDVARRQRELDERQEALEREAERAFWPLVDGAIRAGTARLLTR